MSEKPFAAMPLEPALEPERYELSAPPAYRFDVDRRDFFRFLGAGMLVVCAAREALAQQESGGGQRQGGRAMPQEVGAWLHIGEDGAVTAYTGKAEVGQNIRTSLTQAVAEELRVPLDSIKLVMGDTALVPYDQGTFGSRTTPVMNLQLRRAAHAAREALVELAAEQWQCAPARLSAVAGRITDSSTKRAAAYGELVAGRKLTHTVSAAESLIPAASWKVQGQPARKVDGRAFVTGRHKYPSDIRLPGMLYGKVLRPPSFEALLVSAKTEAAEKLPGVTVAQDGNFLGVTAPSAELAQQALSAMEAQWREQAGQPSSKEIFEYLKKNPAEQRGRGGSRANEVGSLEQGFAEAEHRLEQTYTVAYIAHAPLEPRAAVAQWEGEKLTVWTGTQRPFGVRSELAEAFRIPEEQVRVLMPDTGSGYGGKHTGETAVEAARLARAAGRPVKVVWTREEEFTWAYARPAGVIEVRSGVRSDGVVTAWEFHNYNSGGSAIRPMYAFPNQRIQFHPARSPLRQGSYRGLAATANHFARETHMDELAPLVKMDPLEFRLRNTKDERLRGVLEAAAKQFGWGKSRAAAGHGFGIAGGFEKDGYVATCAEVAVDRATGEVRVVRAVTAFDCGAVVNPDGLRNQIEGSVIMGLGGALFESLEFADGRLLNPRFSAYRLPRFSDTPALETVLVDRKDLPSAGAGETPIVGIAPAVGNAIFAATGMRLRSLPLAPSGISVARVAGD